MVHVKKAKQKTKQKKTKKYLIVRYANITDSFVYWEFRSLHD